MYKVGDKLKLSDNVRQFGNFVPNKIYEIAMQKQESENFLIFDDNNEADFFDEKQLSFYFVLTDDKSLNNGGSTDYYKLPSNAKDLQDLIEDKEMHWNIANIFKSCYRLGQQNHSNAERDINKIIWFAERHKQLLKKKIL